MNDTTEPKEPTITHPKNKSSQNGGLIPSLLAGTITHPKNKSSQNAHPRTIIITTTITHPKNKSSQNSSMYKIKRWRL